MARSREIQFAFPEFSGTTRKLVLWNLGAYFALLLLGLARIASPELVLFHLGLFPANVLSGEVWQFATYSFVHLGIFGTLMQLLSIWILGGILESFHGGRWLAGLYAASVLGAALTPVVLYGFGLRTGFLQQSVPITGALGGIFGLLMALGLAHGEMEFQLFFLITIKAKYLAAIYALIALAQAFGEQRMYGVAQLGALLAAWLFIAFAPRRGWGFNLSEGWYGLRNRYYRWKRRRAAAKFQVYMRKQGRTLRFDGRGHLIDEDQDDATDPSDRTRWN
jgi:membrane associated rhomboid family serine protease